MKSQKAKHIEAIAQELLNSPTEETQERMDIVKQRAFQEYLTRIQNEARNVKEPPVRFVCTQKGLGQRLMTACALALAIIIFPVVVTMISPVSVSSADDDWKRSVVIWLNDTFHTEIKVPDSLHDQGGLYSMMPGEERIFYTVNDAAAFLNEDLLVLGNDEVACELQSITISTLGEGIYRITEEYLCDTTKITVVLKTALSSQVLSPPNDTIIVQSDLGSLIGWNTENESCAFCIYNEWQVLVSAECQIEKGIMIFSSLHKIN